MGRNTNIYEVKKNYAILKLFSKTYGNKEVLVDIEDIDRLKNICWCFHKSGYINGRDMQNNGKKILLHRFVTNCPFGLVIDHINRNKLDNRKYNLKICTQLENMANSSLYSSNKLGYKNISYQKSSRSFIITVRVNKKNKTLCYKKDLNEAVKARNEYYRSIGKDEDFIGRLDR